MVKVKFRFLFRSVTKSWNISPQGLDSTAAQARLNAYTTTLSHSLSSAHFTLHGFRSGAAVSLALAGLSLHKIIDHEGWKNSKRRCIISS